MKWCFFILSVILTCQLVHADDEPEPDPRVEQAITYLKRLSKGKLDIANDTALSPNCSVSRRRHLRSRLRFIRKNYLRENDTLKVEAIENRGDFTAVLIHASHPSQPLSPRIHPVGLLKRGGKWLPAPLLGTFLNTGYGFDQKTEQQVTILERWMTKEKVSRETSYRNKAVSTLKTRLTKLENEMKLNEMTAGEAVSHFIEQCRTGDFLRVLAAMGAASGGMSEPLESVSNTISRGLTVKASDNDWNFVNQPSCIYTVMKHDKKRDEIAVGFYNPTLRRQSRILYFPITTKDKKKFVKLSPMLTVALLPNDEKWEQRWQHRREDESKLVLEVPAVIMKNITAKNSASPEKLLGDLLESIKEDDFRSIVTLLPKTKKLFAEKSQQTILLANLASFWKDFSGLKSAPEPQHEIIKNDSIALAPLQLIPHDRPGKIRTRHVWMLKSDQGWHLVPENSLRNLGDKAITRSMNSLENQLESLKARQHAEISRKMLKLATTIKPDQLQKAPTENACRDLFKQYRNSLRSDDQKTALSCCACFASSDNTRTLRKFNYALRGANAQLNDDQILAVSQAGKWSGISARTQSKDSDRYDYPLILCVQTGQGTRILIDIDLRHASNKGRELLNKKQWIALEEVLLKEEITQIKTIYDTHTKLVLKDKEALKKLHE